MKYTVPQCISCPNFNGMPYKFGEKATCSKYPKGIPQSIYPKGSQCPKAKKGDSNGSRKK